MVKDRLDRLSRCAGIDHHACLQEEALHHQRHIVVQALVFTHAEIPGREVIYGLGLLVDLDDGRDGLPLAADSLR